MIQHLHSGGKWLLGLLHDEIKMKFGIIFCSSAFAYSAIELEFFPGVDMTTLPNMESRTGVVNWGHG